MMRSIIIALAGVLLASNAFCAFYWTNDYDAQGNTLNNATLTNSTIGATNTVSSTASLPSTVVLESDVDDTPVDNATTDPISSNWAYDHVAASDPHPGYLLETGNSWTPSGNATVNPVGGYIFLDGLVGIGTTTPTEELVVGDNLGTSSVHNRMVVGDTDGDAGIYVGESSTENFVVFWKANLNYAGLASFGYQRPFFMDGSTVVFGANAEATQDANIGFWTDAQFGGGAQVIGIEDAGTVPSSNPTGGAILYADGGELKGRDSAGNVATLTANVEDWPDGLAVSASYPYAVPKVQASAGIRTWRAEHRALEILEQLALDAGLLAAGEHLIIHESIEADADPYAAAREAAVTQWIADSTELVEVPKAQALVTDTVLVDDREHVMGQISEYKLLEGRVVEIKRPQYAKRVAVRVELADDASFDPTTGKFYRRMPPTAEQVQAYREQWTPPELPKWVKNKRKQKMGEARQ